jgi:DNA-binding response OmpR family regulator
METKRHILIVDDEPGIGRFLSIKLRLSGYEVKSTTSGAEAIDLVRSQEPDVILLDVLMPEVTGMDVLVEVRSWSKVPIILFTGQPNIIEFASRYGADDFIEKPINYEFLVKKIENLLDVGTNSPVEK